MQGSNHKEEHKPQARVNNLQRECNKQQPHIVKIYDIISKKKAGFKIDFKIKMCISLISNRLFHT